MKPSDTNRSKRSPIADFISEIEIKPFNYTLLYLYAQVRELILVQSRWITARRDMIPASLDAVGGRITGYSSSHFPNDYTCRITPV
jgi:hypothetical protein